MSQKPSSSAPENETQPSVTPARRGRPRLILHVGRHKSGTSNLQRHLALNEAFLREQNILYPKTLRNDRMQHAFWLPLLKPGADRLEMEAARASLLKEAEGYDTLIMSTEGMQDLKDPEPFETLFEGFDITTIGYVREYVEYCAKRLCAGDTKPAHRSRFRLFRATL
jgi:hypothetical protein